MDALIYTLKNLPENGRRLDGGLALRLTKGNGWAVLGCSRVGQPPSEQEMKVLTEAVVEAFGPQRIWRGEKPSPVAYQGAEHYVWRLYWSLERMEQVYEDDATQEKFPF